MSDIKLILDSPEFWKSVAFLLVVILTIFPFYSFAIKTARAKVEKVKLQLGESEKLRKEAESLLREVQGKNFNRVKERQKTVCKALKEVHQLENNFKETSKKGEETRRKALSRRLSLVKEAGLKKIKEDVIKKTIQITDSVLENEEIFGKKDIFFDKALKEFDNVLSDKGECDKLVY